MPLDYTDPDFISQLAQAGNDPEFLRKLAMTPVDPMESLRRAQDAGAQLQAPYKGYYTGDMPTMDTTVPGQPSNQAGIGRFLVGAATGVPGYRPPAPAVVTPHPGSPVGSATHAQVQGAPMPERRPYNIGRLIIGR